MCLCDANSTRSWRFTFTSPDLSLVFARPCNSSPLLFCKVKVADPLRVCALAVSTDCCETSAEFCCKENGFRRWFVQSIWGSTATSVNPRFRSIPEVRVPLSLVPILLSLSRSPLRFLAKSWGKTKVGGRLRVFAGRSWDVPACGKEIPSCRPKPTFVPALPTESWKH